MKRLAIIGSGDLGQLIAHHASNANQYQVAGFFDDYKKKGEMVSGIGVLGGTKDISTCFKNNEFDELMIGIGYKHMVFRKKMYETYSSSIPFGKVVHSSSYIDSSCSISNGVFILPGCVLDCHVVIEENVLLNTGCIIAHNSCVGKHSFLSPGVKIAGFVKVKEDCNIGINTTIIDNITINSNIQTGGGTVVIKDLEKPGLYVGNPARFIR